MKAIINGKRYDTAKALLIGEHMEGYAGDFDHWSAGLYLTPRSREFFLAGGGGAMTRWARKVDRNTRTGGEGIVPMSIEDARDWAARYLDADVVAQYFAVEDA